MEDDLVDIIRRARKTVVVAENDENGASSMPEIRHSSFDSSLNGESKGRTRLKAPISGVSLEVSVYQWAEMNLRVSGSKFDRTLMAVRDAARLVAGKGNDPSSTAFYVATSIAKGWNLNTRQLSEGLKELEKAGRITVTDRRKGRHLRMILAKIRPP